MKKHIIHLLGFALSCTLLMSCQTMRFSRNPEALVPVMTPPKKPATFALVLGGGGARGLAHIGVLEVLEQAGLKPDLIIGCSAGAIVGSLYASRLDTKWLKSILLPKNASHFLGFQVSDFPVALLSNVGLEKFLQQHLGNKRFQDLQIPFVAVATNLQTGRLTPFFTGPVVKPVLASSAIPGAFNPVELYNTYYVDGGVADPVPVQTARDLHAQFVLAVEVPQKLSSEPPANMLDVMWRSLIINYSVLSKQNASKADLVIEVPIADVGMFSDDRNINLYLLGREKAIEALPEIQRRLAK
jgi:NTE family protein